MSLMSLLNPYKVTPVFFYDFSVFFFLTRDVGKVSSLVHLWQLTITISMFGVMEMCNNVCFFRYLYADVCVYVCVWVVWSPRLLFKDTENKSLDGRIIIWLANWFPKKRTFAEFIVHFIYILFIVCVARALLPTPCLLPYQQFHGVFLILF